jgi:MinD-like ATPase involved in chromosome partitioning or flagellar assembly
VSLPLVTAVAPRWESGLAGSLSTSRHVHVTRRCADVAELLGVVAAGVGRVAVVSADLRGLDRSVVDTLRQHEVLVLGVHPPEDEAAARTLLRWGLPVVVPADSGGEDLDEALEELLGQGGATTARPPEPRAVARESVTEHPEHLQARGPGQPADRRPGEGHDPAREGASPPPDTTHRDDQALSQALRGDAGGAAYPDLGRAGEGTDGPTDPEELEDDETPGAVIVVWGPTGGPGRTTVAVNLAAELADALSPVLLVDADTYGASAAQTLAVLDEVPGLAAATRAADQGTLDRSALARLAPEVRPGLRILTGLPRADRWPEIRDVALADVLDQCRRLARWTVVDVAAPLEQDEELSFDTLAPRRNGAALTALDAADRVVVVGTGDPVGLQRLVRGLDLLSACTHAERTVVVTRVRPGPVGPDPGRRIREALDRFASAGRVHLVPEDQEALDVALLHGRALLEVRPRSAARLAIAALADVVADRAPASRRERARAGRRWLPGRRVATA